MSAIATPWAGVGHMLSLPFMRHAFVAGTPIAAVAGLVGYFVVLRRQVFTGDALAHVAFTGSVAALAFGADARIGLFAATIGGALLLGLLGPRARADDVVVGSVFAWVLGLGVLFLSIFATSAASTSSRGGIGVLFGTIFGLDRAAAIGAALVAAAVGLGMVAVARPLLFASLDETVAAARGVPVRALGLLFLILVGVAAAEAAQAVGALLLLGLLAGPAAVAHRLCSRPFPALWLSAGLAAAAMWVGLTLSYAVPRLPPSFSVMAVVAALYVAALLVPRARLTSCW